MQGIVCIAPSVEVGYQLDLLEQVAAGLSAFVPDAASVVQDCPGHAH